jgi:hypothetical protein
MIISVVVLMVLQLTTVPRSRLPGLDKALRGSFGHRNRMWTQKRKNRAMMVKTISRDELNQRIDLKDNFPLVETFDRWDLSSPTLPERH